MVRLIASILMCTAVLMPVSASAGGGWDRMAIKPEEASVLRQWFSQSGAMQKVSSATDAGGTATATVVRGERLALGRYQAARLVPEDVLARLPEQPKATRLIVLDGQVVRVFRPTRSVVDILRF